MTGYHICISQSYTMQRHPKWQIKLSLEFVTKSKKTSEIQQTVVQGAFLS